MLQALPPDTLSSSEHVIGLPVFVDLAPVLEESSHTAAFVDALGLPGLSSLCLAFCAHTGSTLLGSPSAMCAHVRVRACVRACVSACVRACLRACVRADPGDCAGVHLGACAETGMRRDVRTGVRTGACAGACAGVCMGMCMHRGMHEGTGRV